MTIRSDHSLSPLPPPSRVDRGVPGVFHRGANRRRSRRRRIAWPVRERRLGPRLDSELAGWAIALHSRLPGADLDCQPVDHLIVAPAGVWVIAANHHVRYLTTAICTDAIENQRTELVRQGAAVRAVVSSIGFDWLDIDLVVCATNARGVRRRPTHVDGIRCAGSGAVASMMSRPGPLGHPDVATIAAELSRRFPAAR